MTHRKIITQMLEALEHIQRCIGFGTATIHFQSATWCESNDAIAAAREYLAAPEQSEPVTWMPIETAPKSEVSPFLVFVPMDDVWDGAIVQVSMFEGRMYPDARGAVIDWNDAVESATHWMPLPPEPGDTHPAPKAEPVNQQLLEALRKIATVNAMDYEYQRWAKAALAAAEQAQGAKT